jgi:hypothetical protein
VDVYSPPLRSRALSFFGFFAGNLIYRSIREDGASWRIAFDSFAVAAITVGLIVAFDKLRKPKRA